MTATERATVDAILAELPMSDDGTGHVADCGYTHEEQTCSCYTLPERIAAHVARAREEGRAEVEANYLQLVEQRDDWYRMERAWIAADYEARAERLRSVLADPPALPPQVEQAKAEAWDEAHDKFCPRGKFCSTHLRPGDRHHLADRATPGGTP